MSKARTPPALKFAPGSRRTAEAAAEAGEWAATVRYDDERGISSGDRLRLTDEEGDQFATGRVQAAVECSVSEATQVIQRHEARHAADSPVHLRSLLNYHYDSSIGLNTTVKVVVFAVKIPDSLLRMGP
jgi:hypothetical protein